MGSADDCFFNLTGFILFILVFCRLSNLMELEAAVEAVAELLNKVSLHLFLLCSFFIV